MCAHFACIFECGRIGCAHVFPDMYVCVSRPFPILLGSLICFGSVWWAGHGANYLLKGKSEPNEPHWATEVTGLIKHSVCITGYLTQDPTVHWIFTGLHTHLIHTKNIRTLIFSHNSWSYRTTGWYLYSESSGAAIAEYQSELISHKQPGCKTAFIHYLLIHFIEWKVKHVTKLM